MKVVLLLAFLAAVTLASRVPFYSIVKAEEYFQQFVQTYNKTYASDAEKAKRFEIFKHNLELINKKNAESESAVFGITFFSDLSKDEFIQRHTGLREGLLREGNDCTAGKPGQVNAPDSWDWRDKGVVSKAKDQRSCGSCWAFSATGNMEAQYAKKYKTILDLAEQQLVDCDKSSFGCQGTSRLENPFGYLKSHGQMEEKDYSYVGQQEKCNYDQSKVKAKVSDCVYFKPNNEDELKSLAYKDGPVSIGVDANDWQNYHSGVLSKCSFSGFNHAVLLVGYGTENGVPYWVIKNSWGEDFGEKGFIKIKRGVNACGIKGSDVVNAIIE